MRTNSGVGTKQMQRIAVDSESVVSIGYDEASETMEVEFESGQLYRYFAVPAAVHRQFVEADSKGRFFHRNIKDKYRYARG